jgi:hypothetical protein
MELTAGDGLTIAVFTAEPGSSSEQALSLLGIWAATLDPAPQPDDARRKLARRDAPTKNAD